MSEMAEIAVIGAGVVGLAIARAAAEAGLAPMVLDAESRFGSVTSSRNSEVIHAGIYYPPGSLKARACVEGRDQLYAYCEARGVPHRRIGKLVFASDASEVAALDTIEQRARACGVFDLVRLSGAEAARLEPALRCYEALLSPSTGIVDAHGLMLQLLADAENGGGQFVPHCRVTGLSRCGDGWGVHVDGDPDPALVAARVVNAGGLEAHRLAANTEGLRDSFVPMIRYARGHYFTYAGKVPFDHLIYPVPVPGGLGTHLTLDMGGQARFGPDVEWVEEPEYSVDPARKNAFLAAARRIWPDIDPDKLTPGYAGIRPKLSGPGEPAADFRIDGPAEHGLSGLVNLFGIESPGLTASLSLAGMVLERLELAEVSRP